MLKKLYGEVTSDLWHEYMEASIVSIEKCNNNMLLYASELITHYSRRVPQNFQVYLIEYNFL